MKKIYLFFLGGLLFVNLNSCNSPDLSGAYNAHEAVDLGLPSGVLWATCNIGAEKPEEYGHYFAWGEVVSKISFTWETYKYATNITQVGYDYEFELTKYSSILDGITILEANDDVATLEWGKAWRMPTKIEIDELKEYCTWTWTTKNGINGYEVKGTNDNCIFLPASGYYRDSLIDDFGEEGHYWSSSLGLDDNTIACGLNFYWGGKYWYLNSRACGLSIRPVYEISRSN